MRVSNDMLVKVSNNTASYAIHVDDNDNDKDR